MASHARLYGIRGRPAQFDDMLGHALASPEIAEPARQLGIPRSRLDAIVPREHATAVAATAHREWEDTRNALERIEERHKLVVARQRSHRLRRRLRVDLRPQRVWTEQVAILDAEIARLRATEETLRQAYVDTLYERGILPRLRAYLDERGDRTWSTTLSLSADDAPGLAELRGSSWVPHAAIDRVADLMRRMPGGSIGVSGPRGAGKTTLIRRFTGGSHRIGVYVSAPTQYDAREFLLHLFATLCSTVIAAMGGGQPPRSRSALRRVVDWMAHPVSLALATFAASVGLILASVLHAHVDARLLAGLAFLGLAIDAGLAAIGARLAFRGKERSRLVWFTGALTTGAVVLGSGLVVLSQLSPATPLWGWGVVGLTIGTLLVLWPPSSDEEIAVGDADAQRRLRQLARDALEGIRFQMTLSSGWSGTAKLPFAEGVLSGGRSLASRPMSLPEVTAAMEDFIREASAVRSVVIGIDELDKIESGNAAHQFLNEIKGIFGIPGCFFLVSVSEEAMSNFARRDARLRDAFDSSFDEIVHLRPLSLEQSRAVLSERVIGLPVQFAALCHVLAGGLPRDLIRYARLALSLNGGVASLEELVRDLLAHELGVRARAAAIQVRGMRSHAAALPVLSWLADVEHAVDELAAACAADDAQAAPDAADPEARAELLELVIELKGFCYFALTLRETFDERLDRTRFEALQQGPEAGSLDALARARATFSVNALLAWQEVSAFRGVAGLPLIRPPQL